TSFIFIFKQKTAYDIKGSTNAYNRRETPIQQPFTLKYFQLERHFFSERLSFFQFFDPFRYNPKQQRESRFSHASVIKAVQLIKITLLVSGHFHHSPHIRILLVSAKHLQFGISRNQMQRRRVFPHMEKRRITIDGGLESLNSIFLPNGKVRNGVPAKRNGSSNTVCIHPETFQIGFVKRRHSSQISTSGMA